MIGTTSSRAGGETTGDQAQYSEGVIAPPTELVERTYDLRVALGPAGGELEPGMPVAVEVGALVVEAPGVNLMDPRVGDPALVAGGDTFTVTFRSDFTGDYAIQQSVAGEDDWDDLAPVDDDGRSEAGETTTVTVTAPARDADEHDNNTHDLRVMVTPDDPEEPGPQDTEEAALRVASVDILAPQGDPTVPADSHMDVELTANVDAEFELLVRENSSGQDYAPFDPAVTGSVGADDTVSVTIRTADGNDDTSYDLRVEISLDGGAAVAADAEEPAFTLGSGNVELVAPTGTTPAITTTDGTFGFAFTTDVSGGYRLSVSLDGSTWESRVDCGTATHNPPDDNVSTTHNTGSATAPVEPGTYDVRIELFGSSDCFGPPLDSDTEQDALVVQAAA